MKNPFLSDSNPENLSKRLRDTLNPLIVGESVCVGLRGKKAVVVRATIKNSVEGKFRTKADKSDSEFIWVQRVE